MRFPVVAPAISFSMTAAAMEAGADAALANETEATSIDAAARNLIGLNM
jgi:hypothetical protein